MVSSKPRSKETTPRDSDATHASATPSLKHNPFGSLKVAAPALAARSSKPLGKLSPENQGLEVSSFDKILLRQEYDSQEAKVVTRVIGVPPAFLAALGAQLRKALGCSAAIEGRDLILMGELEERACLWLKDAGARRVVRVMPAPAQKPLSERGVAGGKDRSQIRRGLLVAIVQKPHQETGELTEGVVSEILTPSPVHPRGIKVRLESGIVGRVQRILG